MTKPFLEMKFTAPTGIAQKMLGKALQIRKNLEHAVASTTLLGITRICMDTPVDTGRLRASIAGEFSGQVPVDISGPEVAQGKKETATFLDIGQLEAQIGTNVEYAPHVEFGHRVVVKSMGRKIAKKDSKTGKVRRVAGKAMFRKNIPVIRTYWRQQTRLAVTNGLQGKGMVE